MRKVFAIIENGVVVNKIVFSCDELIEITDTPHVDMNWAYVNGEFTKQESEE